MQGTFFNTVLTELNPYPKIKKTHLGAKYLLLLFSTVLTELNTYPKLKITNLGAKDPFQHSFTELNIYQKLKKIKSQVGDVKK